MTNRTRILRIAAPGLASILLILAGCASPQQKEARFLESGKKMMERQDYPRAIIQFQNAAKTMPKDGEAYYQLGLAYFADKQLKAGGAALQRSAKLGHSGAKLKLAEIEASEKDLKHVTEAQNTIQTLMQSGPVTAEELDALAFTEWKLNNKEDAEKHLEDAFEKFPADLRSAANLARVKLAKNDIAGAEEVLKKAAAQNPPLANAFVALGSFYVRVSRNAEAEQQFQRALQIDSTNAPALLNLAALQFRNGQKDQAEQTYARVSALPVKDYKAVHALFLATTGKAGAAVPEFEKLSKQNPGNRTYRSYLVKAYATTGRLADAQKILDAALAKNPKDVEALTERGTLLLVTGKTAGATKDIEQGLRYGADSAQLHYLMARINELQGDRLKQNQELNEALRLRPDYLAARLQLSKALISSGSAKDALDLLNLAPDAQKKTPAWITADNWALIVAKKNDEARKQIDQTLAVIKTPELLQQDAILRIGSKDYAGARNSLNQALAQAPESVALLRALAATYAAQNQPAQELDAVRAYARQHPASAPLQQFLGELLLANGRRDEARRALEAAKAADPKSIRADLVLAQLDSADGHADLAARRLNSVLAGNPNNTVALLELAAIQEKAGKQDDAIANYRKVLAAQPTNVVALNNLAFALAEYRQKPDEALAFAQKAVELAPQQPAVEDTLGWVLYHKGLYKMALPHLEKAAKADSTARRDCHLAMTYISLGDSANGTKYLKEAISKDASLPEIKAAQQLLDQMAR